ncbi:NDR1/HIN1-like protein 10 [Ananas comosus]|uniref:NDR1/HIN1-like protein 10 n=2 Tax=Ananas comosus TaxID=4615 RepID=A0A6P5FQY9_ANACO|nr:NDR1/HIN1-like protein 10 [Ananas comosus]CAD1818022.1 unnamed protein product [Ananas comosus var. bracteatus]
MGSCTNVVLCCGITTFIIGLVIVLPIVLTIALDVQVSVEDATLARFALADKPTALSYNLSTVVRLHNPNYYYGVYYDQVEANFFFDGQRFDWLTLPNFYQHPKKTSRYYPAINGQSDITLGTTGLNNFVRENQTGLFSLELQLDAYVRFKKTHCRLLVTCPLAVRLTVAAGTTAAAFQRSKCSMDYPYDGNANCFCQKTNSCDD